MTNSSTVRLLTNPDLGKVAPAHGFGDEFLSTVQERDLLDVFKTDYLSIMVDSYQGNVSKDKLEAAAAVLRSALGQFQPDIIITYTSAAFLRSAYPDALIWHMEYGFYSRPPFPESFYLDPFGKFKNSALGMFEHSFKAYETSRDEEILVEKVRARFLDDILTHRSPYSNFIQSLRNRFDAIILLPLQFSGHYGFDGTCDYGSQDEYLEAVAMAVPEKTCLVALPHSTSFFVDQAPDESLISRLQRDKQNLIMHPDLNAISHPSQFMLAHVDAVASVSSSVALQGLLWGIDVIALGDSHVNAIASSFGIESLKTSTFRKDRERCLPALAWLLHHYCIPAPYFFNPQWITEYVKEGLNRWNDGLHGLDFFSPIDDPLHMAKLICDAADDQVPLFLNRPDSN